MSALVKSGHRDKLKECPLYPQRRTLELGRGMSALCQKRTSPNAAAHSALITSPTLFASMSLSSTVKGEAASSNLTLLRTPAQPLTPVEVIDCTLRPSCTTSIQP